MESETDLDFEWEEDKAAANLKKHKISFDEAKTVFADPFSITIDDPAHSVGEHRFAEKRLKRSEKYMKKENPKDSRRENDEMSPEHNFRRGVRGKHYKAYRRGHTVTIHKTDGTTDVRHFKLEEGAVMLEPDVQAYFPDSEAVNKALRGLITLLPRKPKTRARA